jgi:geranylgeranyl diphosphate synthase, type I
VDIRTEFTDLLTEIEEEMRGVLARQDGPARPLYEMLSYHLGLDQPDGPRGKRMRPLLGLLAYEALTGDYRSALPGAAAVELGHNFSLVHDDIEDADAERRHRPTLWAIWGVPLAINAGDALFALSRLALYRSLEAGTISEHRLLELMRMYDETCLALCEGQFLDISFERRTDVTVEEYMEMIGRKTAALMGASLQAGAILATEDSTTIEAFRQFGYHIGLAFQMADDVKGTFWPSAESGKPEAGDLRKRKKTLPLVWALQHSSDADATRLREIYTLEASGPMPQPEVDEVLAILERTGAREEALTEARRYRDIALRDLDGLPIADERRIELRTLLESVIAV